MTLAAVEQRRVGLAIGSDAKHLFPRTSRTPVESAESALTTHEQNMRFSANCVIGCLAVAGIALSAEAAAAQSDRQLITFFCRHVPQHGVAQHRLGQKLLQSSVLVLQRPQPPGIRNLRMPPYSAFHL